MDQPKSRDRAKAVRPAGKKGAQPVRQVPPKLKKKKGGAFKWFFGLFAFLLLILGGAYLVLSLGPVRAEFLRDNIESQLQAKLGAAEFELGEIFLTTHDLGLGILVETLNVTSQDGQTQADLGQLKLGFAPWSPIFATGSRIEIGQADVRLPAEARLSVLMHELIVTAAQDVPGTKPLTQADIVAHLFNRSGQLLRMGFDGFADADIAAARIDNLSILVANGDSYEAFVRGGQFTYQHSASVAGDDSGSAYNQLSVVLPGDGARYIAQAYDQSASDIPLFKLNLERELLSPQATEQLALSDDFIVLNGPLYAELDLLIDQNNSRIKEADGVLRTSDGSLRLGLENYALGTNALNMHWRYGEAGLTLNPSDIKIGAAKANVSGLVDLDPSLSNPSIGLSFEARNLEINPTDMTPQTRPIQQMTARLRYEFAGRRLSVEDINVVDRIQLMSGRGEVVFDPEGPAISGDLEAQNASLDQTLRLWPSFISTQTRAWTVEHLSSGRLEKSYMQFNFPAGTIKPPTEATRIPQDGLTIDITAVDLTLSPGGEIAPISSNDVVSLAVRDHRLAATVAKATISDGQHSAALESVNYEIPDTFLDAPQNILTARVKGPVDDILVLADRDPINVMEALEIGLAPQDFKGSAALDLSAQFKAGLVEGAAEGAQYSVTGAVTDFSALKEIEGRSIREGTFTFSADPAGFALNGTARLDRTISDLSLVSAKNGALDVKVQSVLTAKQRADLGLELLNDYITGPINYRAQPREGDDGLDVEVFFKQAEINISDLAVKKPKGTEAEASFIMRTNNKGTRLQNFEFRFDEVRVGGELAFDADSRLISADFPTFKLTDDDTASMKVSRVADGFEVRIKGEQMNLQSILTRFFGLEEDSRLEAQTDIEGANLTVIADIGRAIGFFKTTAFNVKLNIKVRGPTLKSIAGRASLGGDKTLSVTTNPLGSGKVITYAANDVGTMMRFVGLYPRLLGGVGSLVVDYNEGAQTQSGQVSLKDFALINENAMVRIVGNHARSRDFVSAQERLAFRKGQARFSRSEQELIVHDLSLEGPQMGVNLKGRIDSVSKQIDMVGTYIPLFGLNSALKDVPLIGQLQGDALIGVTFAIRGALSDPKFAVNPASALAPGVFRRLFEFQQRSQ